METTFKPCYVWPGKTIPFRIYYSDDRVRIFIIENLQFNFNWMQTYKDYFRDTDVFFVLNTTFYHDWLVSEASDMFETLGMNKEQFKILFNDDREKNIFEKYGFSGEIVNLHSWIENSFTYNIMPGKKSYTAIYIAKLIESNRHELASNIEDLALITSDSYGALTISKVPSNTYINETNLTEIEIAKKINESICGLSLSELDVGEFAVCNYFLCGVPIITTHKEGISQIWINENNSVIVESENRNIIEASEILKKSPRNPELIRNECIAKIEENRNRFKKLLSETFRIRQIDYINVNLFFDKSISHNKITNFIVPKFEYIFSE